MVPKWDAHGHMRDETPSGVLPDRVIRHSTPKSRSDAWLAMDASHYQTQWQQPYQPNLSLNLSSLSVTSPAALSPATPISPPFTGPIHQSFQFDTASYDDRPPTSRRKRSFSTNSAGLVDYDVDASSYASEEMPHSGYADGNGSGSDEQRPQPSAPNSSSTSTMPGAGINVLGKPMGTNNFVTKLYQ